FGDPRGGNARDSPLDTEAVLLEDAGEILRRLDLLHPELAEREHLVDHLLGELGACVYRRGELRLEAIEARVRPGLCRLRRCRRRMRGDEQGEDERDDASRHWDVRLRCD